MSVTSIHVEGLSKQYRIGELQRHDTLRDQVAEFARVRRQRAAARLRGQALPRSEPTTIWAVRDLDLDVEAGEVVGVVGRNGAGKSTVLSLLSRITEPTAGRAEIHGRVGSLLEVGTGFHPELTGRDNVYLNGAILGMSRDEIRRKFDQIVEFAEVARFIDTPVKRYSSGMQMRLAFSVAAHLDTEILLIDEVLAVGDSRFQARCLGKMGEVASAGRTVLFVSHNMGAVADLCTRAILLEHGQKVRDASVSDVLEYYARPDSDEGVPGHLRLDPDPTLACSILEVRIAGADGAPAPTFDVGSEIVIELVYEVGEPVTDLLLNVTLSRNMAYVFTSFDTDGQIAIQAKLPGRYVARHRIPPGFLKAGIWSLTVGSGTPTTQFQSFVDLVTFDIEELSENTALRGYRKDRPGNVISPGAWTTEKIA
jgi:lipopolysaccharide transport system ATP-binding protein